MNKLVYNQNKLNTASLTYTTEEIEEIIKERFKLHQALCERNETIEKLQQRIDKAIELLNTYITNEKSNIKSDYYLIYMFEKSLSILRGEE